MNLETATLGQIKDKEFIIEDIVLSLRRQNINKLLIINGHGGNSFKGIVRDMAFYYPDFKIFITDWFAIVPPDGFFENKGEHADEVETSVILHYHPLMVDMPAAGIGSSRKFKSESLNAKVAWLPRNWK